MLKNIAVIAGLAVFSIGTPTVAQTTNGPEIPCGTVCFCCQIFGSHLFAINSGAGTYTGYQSHDCSSGGYHGSCGYGAAKETYSRILEAAESGEVDELLKLAVEASDYVMINRERQSVMVRACRGDGFVANLPYKQKPSTLSLIAQLEAIQTSQFSYAGVSRDFAAGHYSH